MSGIVYNYVFLLYFVSAVSTKTVGGYEDPHDWHFTNSVVDRLRDTSNGLSTSTFQLSRFYPNYERVRDAVIILLESVVTHIVDEVLPAIAVAARNRRSTGPEAEKASSYLESFATGIGAVLDRQDCRQYVTCHVGKTAGKNIPGAQVAVMLLENVIPASWLGWFRTVKTAVIDRSENCDVAYHCQIIPPPEKSRLLKT